MAELKRKTIDGAAERLFVTGLITNTQFFKEIRYAIRTDLIKTPFVKMISNWCVDYYDKFDEAPGATIQKVFESRRVALDEPIEVAIDVFLESISDQYDRDGFNIKYAKEESIKYFKAQSLLSMTDEVKVAVGNGEIDKADTIRSKYESVDIYESAIISPFSPEAVEMTYAREDNELLFSLKGDIGKMIRPFCRGDFVGLLAPMKRGKTFTLTEWGWRAHVFGKLNVLFVSLEMTEVQMNKRLYSRACDTFILDKWEEDNPNSYHRKVVYPTFDEQNDIKLITGERQALTENQALKMATKMSRNTKGSEFKLKCVPGHLFNISKLMEIVDMERIHNDFMPDVIIIDYLDIMGTEPGSPKDFRHQIDHTWKRTADAAKELNCCIIGATQGGRSAFSRDITQEDIPEDIRKLAHVSRMIAINSGYSEEEDGEMDDALKNVYKKYSLRLNMLAERHGYFDPDKKVRVLTCLELSNPLLDSRLIEKVKGSNL